MSGTPVGLSVEDPESPSTSQPKAARLSFKFTPVVAVITVATILALALRVYQLVRPGHLLGVGDYDEGADFGTSVLLVHGVLPYRDFVTVQPPGITLLMLPAALLSRLIGTAGAIGVGRILTVLASAGGVVFGGLIVRHRGLFAVIATCGLIAIFPGSVEAAHTVLLEPWLVLFCLAGVALAFDGDALASNRRLMWSGVAFGFAGAIKLWAVIPAAVLLVILLAKRHQVVRYLVGVAAGFLVPVLPFAALAPGRFYHDVVQAQVVRPSARIHVLFRIQQMVGLANVHPSKALVELVAVIVVAGLGGALLAASLATRQWPSVLEWFAIAVAALVAVAFLVPDDFYYHYPAFLVPFLAMAFALPAARFIDNANHPEEEPKEDSEADLESRPRQQSLPRPEWLPRAAAAVAALVIVVLPIAAPRAEAIPTPTFGAAITAITRVIPAGACVVSDQASVLISADRFVTSAPGCLPVVDGFGASYALGGRSAEAAGAIRAVADVWMRAFGAAQYVLLTQFNLRRIAWTPALRAYLSRNFVLVNGHWTGLQLYARRHPR